MRHVLFAASMFYVLAIADGCRKSPDNLHPAASAQSDLVMLVMDPLADRLACACVAGCAQRKYEELGVFLQARTGRHAKVSYAESLAAALCDGRPRANVVVGKRSVVAYDSAHQNYPLEPLAALTDRQGQTTLRGLFLVRSDDPAHSLADLKGRRIVIGPAWAQEKNEAALAAIKAAGIEPPTLPAAANCTLGALEVVERRADAAVISSYALALLEGCQAIRRGELRVVGQTEEVPFVTVFVDPAMEQEMKRSLLEALDAVKADPQLLNDMESRDGFLKLP